MGINIVELVPIFEDFTSILSKFMISSKFTRILDFFYCKSEFVYFFFFGKSTSPGKGQGTRFPGKRRLLTRKFPEIFQIPAMDYTRLATWSARSRSWKCRNYGGAGEGKTLNFLKKTLNPAKQTNSLGIQHGQRFSHSENTICNRNFCPVLLFSS